MPQEIYKVLWLCFVYAEEIRVMLQTGRTIVLKSSFHRGCPSPTQIPKYTEDQYFLSSSNCLLSRNISLIKCLLMAGQQLLYEIWNGDITYCLV